MIFSAEADPARRLPSFAGLVVGGVPTGCQTRDAGETTNRKWTLWSCRVGFDDEMLTIEELAAFLKLRPQTIYRWAQAGKVPGAKFGKEWRFRRSQIEEWIDRRISASASTPRGSPEMPRETGPERN